MAAKDGAERVRACVADERPAWFLEKKRICGENGELGSYERAGLSLTSKSPNSVLHNRGAPRP